MLLNKQKQCYFPIALVHFVKKLSAVSERSICITQEVPWTISFYRILSWGFNLMS